MPWIKTDEQDEQKQMELKRFSLLYMAGTATAAKYLAILADTGSIEQATACADAVYQDCRRAMAESGLFTLDELTRMYQQFDSALWHVSLIDLFKPESALHLAQGSEFASLRSIN